MVKFYRPERPVNADPRYIYVKSVFQVSPNLTRITFTADELKHEPSYWPACHIKLMFPLDGQVKPDLPIIRGQGPRWNEGASKPHLRTFTVVEHRMVEGEIDVEFATHGDCGPASRFALFAKLGDCIGLSMPGGPKPMFPVYQHYYVAGDATALPAISAGLATLTHHAQGHVYILVPSQDDIQDLVKPQGVEVHWFVGGTEARQALIDEFKTLALAAHDAYFWLAGEEQIVTQLRSHIRRSGEYHRDVIYAIPYWRDGMSEEQYDRPRHAVMDA
ncbi:siderophore-interacting protein [Pseudoalteromonas fenneropenaei]|uniref:Siderophore-interacting protein n=1 Tax=Pseudoalteromonas fenneropenaei TaxID=1737459 RepID=A0ABV7CQ84_9GAMM